MKLWAQNGVFSPSLSRYFRLLEWCYFHSNLPWTIISLCYKRSTSRDAIYLYYCTDDDFDIWDMLFRVLTMNLDNCWLTFNHSVIMRYFHSPSSTPPPVAWHLHQPFIPSTYQSSTHKFLVKLEANSKCFRFSESDWSGNFIFLRDYSCWNK